MRENQLIKKKIARRNQFRNRVRLTTKMLVGTSILMAVSGAFIFIYDYFNQTTHFQARRITVSGLKRLDRQQLLTIAGIKEPVNILSVNLSVARKRLLAEPWIADATVRRKIPSELVIHIREEKPLAILEIVDGQCFIINGAGKVFKRTDNPESLYLPRVKGLEVSDLPAQGLPVTRSFQAVMTLFRLASKRDSLLPLSKIKNILLDREIGATVFLDKDNQAVKLGFGHYGKKIEVFGELMERLCKVRRLADVKVIDLFDIHRIVITPVLPHSAS